MLKEVNKSEKLVRISIIVMFSIILVLNFLTPYTVDDFTYMYSFSDGKRIEKITEIFSSMNMHYITMNGRLVAHFFAQLFLMIPKYIFNFVNAGMYMIQIYMVYKITTIKSKNNLFLLWCIFASIWIFVPAYGQVYLWLDGSCNYLWAITFALLYIYPLINECVGNHIMKSKFFQIIYILSGFLVGSYLESISIGVIIGTFLTIIILKLKKQKIQLWLYGVLFSLILGYLFMVLSPATTLNKAVEFNISLYIENFINAMIAYKTKFLWLIFAWISMMVMGLYSKIDMKYILISIFFLILSLITNFVHIAAAYYPERSMVGAAIFLLMACSILIHHLLETKYEEVIVTISLILLVMFIIEFIIGSIDILKSYVKFEAREKYIIEQRDKGNLDLIVPLINPKTKYSSVYNLRDISVEETNTYPNEDMARYYKINSIIGDR